jgi:hypothetical protein
MHAIGAFLESDNQEALGTLFFFASNAAIIMVEDAFQHLCTKLDPDSRRKSKTQPPSVSRLMLQYGYVLSWLALTGPFWNYRILREHWTRIWPAVSAPVSQYAVVTIAAKGYFVLISGVLMKVIFRISL